MGNVIYFITIAIGGQTTLLLLCASDLLVTEPENRDKGLLF